MDEIGAAADFLPFRLLRSASIRSITLEGGDSPRSIVWPAALRFTSLRKASSYSRALAASADSHFSLFTSSCQRNEDCLFALAEEECGKGLKLMKRLILALGIGWALIYATNHFLLPQEPSKTKFEVATELKLVPTDRRIDSLGAYLPRAAALRDQPQQTPNPQLRQSQEVATLPGDADTKSAEEIASTVGETKQQELKTGVTPDRLMERAAQKPPPIRKAKKSRMPPTSKGRVAQVTADQNPRSRVGSEKRPGLGLFMFAPPGF